MMRPEEVEELARELHFEVFYDETGQMVLLTGVVDETKRTVGLGEEDGQMDMFEDDEEWVEDDFDDDDL